MEVKFRNGSQILHLLELSLVLGGMSVSKVQTCGDLQNGTDDSDNTVGDEI